MSITINKHMCEVCVIRQALCKHVCTQHMFFAAKHQATCLNLTLFLLAVVTNRSQVATGASPHCGMLEPEASNTRTPFCCMIAHIVWLCHALSSASVGMHASGHAWDGKLHVGSTDAERRAHR